MEISLLTMEVHNQAIISIRKRANILRSIPKLSLNRKFSFS